MPDERVDSGDSRRWRLRALLTGMTLLAGASVARSSVERSHDRVCEMRQWRARLNERRREDDRESRPMTPVATPVGRLALSSPPIEPASAPMSLEWTRSLPTLWPLLGVVSSPFGWRRSPYGGEPEWHPGIDITAAYGTPVRATADGRVAFAGRRHGYGTLVVVDHGLASTRYAHLSAVWVRPGQTVLRGEPLGTLGGTGRATAPHLHYELRVGGRPFDPECLLADTAPPRLPDPRDRHGFRSGSRRGRARRHT